MWHYPAQPGGAANFPSVIGGPLANDSFIQTNQHSSIGNHRHGASRHRLFAATAHADDYAKSFTVSNRASVRVDTNDGSVMLPPRHPAG